MKVHYMNILLFALPLNILEHNERDHNNTTLHTSITRSLCECELYAPANYDNDPQMKSVMEIFNKQTQQRLHEYDDRMIEKRKQCKDKCDKEIQKIILKDKIEKQMAQELITLETKITTEDIPTCICEKSLADKTEKFCLNCSKNMGAIAPWWGLVCGTGYAGWSHYVPFAISKAATDAGMNVVIGSLQEHFKIRSLNGISLESFFTSTSYTEVANHTDVIFAELKAVCTATSSSPSDGAMRAGICMIVQNGRAGVGSAERVSNAVNALVEKAKRTAEAAELAESTRLGAYTSMLTNTIIASIIAIVIIVLIMVIIYLILHYRRKKKMKKKIQYIKLLEE
ncbi:hypothetical protein PFFVO_00369 [Plasmodium falciparum Vietnam Oak-Knoll (FVO)]|uniref:Surface antigen n=1 Tax=Plasmodium falciparum Vietnam Oak-Knoll (FVO) TaxID=1036723 RepID=A0A024VCJ5_PLAFA|nr:hypothetical protein PFFVO_00369 [Plasmodium falciparum Vietnam Oak-Knoll (FVO)]